MKTIPCIGTLSNILGIINPSHVELFLYGIFSNVWWKIYGYKEENYEIYQGII